MDGQDKPAVALGAGRFPGADIGIAGIAPVRDYGRVVLGFAFQVGDVGLQLLGFEPRGGLGILAFFQLRMRRMGPIAVAVAFDGGGLDEGAGTFRAAPRRLPSAASGLVLGAGVFIGRFPLQRSAPGRRPLRLRRRGVAFRPAWHGWLRRRCVPGTDRPGRRRGW